MGLVSDASVSSGLICLPVAAPLDARLAWVVDVMAGVSFFKIRDSKTSPFRSTAPRISTNVLAWWTTVLIRTEA